MKAHIRKTRIIILCITILVTAVFFFIVTRSSESDNASFRNLAVKIEYRWYAFTHKQAIVDESKTFIKAQGVPTLVYHGIVSHGDRFSMTRAQFSEQMFALKQAGYHTITPDELVAFLHEQQPLPEKSFLLTFDDGRKDSYYGADPVLHFLGFKAVMFIASHQSLDKSRPSYYLSPEELQNMLDTGRWFIESHARQDDGGHISIDAQGTKGNFLSNLKWLSDEGRLETVDEYTTRVTDELVGSKQEIETTFGTLVDFFSYPFGDYGYQSKNFPESVTIIHQIVSATYIGAFHQIWPADYGYLYNSQEEDPTLLKRLEPAPTLSGIDLVKTLERSSPKALPFTDTFSGDLGWKRSWGTVSIDTKNENLVLSSEKNNNGAFSYVDGSRSWKNYTATAHVSITNNADVSVAGRFIDQDNYIDCFFSNGTVTIRNKHDGELRRATETPNEYVFDPRDATIGIALSGNTVACLLNGHEVVRSSIISSRLSNDGGLGIGMWSNNQSASATISNVSVQEIKSTIEVSILNMPVSTLGILAGESVYTGKETLPRVFPAYPQQAITQLFAKVAGKESVPNTITNNLVPNAEFTDVLSGVPIGWKKDIYKDTHVTFSFDEGSMLTTTVAKIPNEGQAGWYFEPIPVTPGEEYTIAGDYIATTPVLFTAEYQIADGTYHEDRINYLVKTDSLTNVRGVVRIPEGAVSMTASFMLENPGTVSFKNMSVQKLANGSFASGMVSLNFDDGFATSYADVFPLLQKRNLTATHYIISDYVGYSRYMTVAQIHELANANEEVGAHTTKHPRLTTLSLNDLIYEVTHSKKTLEDMGFMVTTFDYPYGSVNNVVRAEVINAGYMGARSTLRGFNTKNTDPFLLRDQHIDRDTTFAEIKAYIDKAVQEKTWLVLEFHDTISGDKSVGEAISPKLLTQILDYIAHANIQSVTMQDGLALMK